MEVLVFPRQVQVEAYGTIDELNAFIGIAKSHIDDSDCLKQLVEIQYDLLHWI